MIVFRIVFGPAQLWDDPTARNSNLFPVKAKGEVRFRSETSRGIFGSASTPISRMPPVSSAFPRRERPASIWRMISSSCSPR